MEWPSGGDVSPKVPSPSKMQAQTVCSGFTACWKPAPGATRTSKKDRARDRVVALRKQNLSVYDIARVLAENDVGLSPASVAQILKQEGFARMLSRAGLPGSPMIPKAWRCGPG